MNTRWVLPGLLAMAAIQLPAQEPAQKPIQKPVAGPVGRTRATEVKVDGAVTIAHGETVLGNGSGVTAGDQGVRITLERGGSMQVCATSNVFLSHDGSIDDEAARGLLMALGHGALETDYTVGKYSDVLMTPDLRVLISGPGQAKVSIRVNSKGDTCVDNHGADAPYVTVSSQLEGGVYRVMPNQRVSFQHGSLLEVVDHEPELCGCPVAPANSLAQANSFPLAQSEGLAPAPSPPRTPVVPPGQAHAQVSVPLVFNGDTNGASKGAPIGGTNIASNGDTNGAPNGDLHGGLHGDDPPPTATTAPQPAAAAPVALRPAGGGNVFHRIGHFFRKIFG